jgi:predicted Zn-dependent protease
MMNSAPHRIARHFLPLLVTALLGACASTTPGGRSQLSAPDSISSAYSSLDLNLTLASLASVTTPCEGLQCEVDKGFERQVARLGTRLAEAAYETYPDLKERIPKFSFVVAEKIEGGSSSNASGTIVIYRGVRKAALEEETLAYLIAREMGHVIARHHDEMSAATILSSLLAQVLLAPANLARGVAFLASSTAGAFGKNLVTRGASAERLNEADAIALTLLNRQGWSDTDISDSLLEYSSRLGKNSWSEDVKLRATRFARSKPAEVLALAP